LLGHGQVIEEGTHDELLVAGQHAEMCLLQASQYETSR